MRPGAFRTLTSGEAALAWEVFGPELDPDPVRIFAIPLWPRAFVPFGRLIVWPAVQALADFTRAPLPLQAVFVHELTHLWQAQAGVNLLMAKLRAGDGPGAYAYDLSKTCDFSRLNIEQQAMVFQHAFLAARGGSAPHEGEAYARILATWREGSATRPRAL
ncbi:hypothetical protein [Phenylobacterium sp.]|uniref:hypothetical protein n=1 Tax=Phenylobacterium sp. TaxID=1871053 RepID=UPI002728C615|nr:hypothetical protein [Phenylobacterium sp.]MDO8378135.1 hypothetical protein [Phenylobacterium sp.]